MTLGGVVEGDLITFTYSAMFVRIPVTRVSFSLPLLMVFSILPAWGQQGGPKFDPQSVQRGKIDFKSSCGFCHGDDATGSRAPDLLRSVTLNHDIDGNLVRPIIRNGRPDQGMPAFANLKENEVSDIITFLHSQAYQALHSAHVARDYPLSKLLTGNAAAGKVYFYGAGGCASCHSVTGDLAGIARKYAPIDLQQRLVYPGGELARTAKVTMAGGSTMEGVVQHADEFTIAIVTKDGWYRSWPLDKVKVNIEDPLEAHRRLTEKYTDANMHDLFAYLETLK